MIKFAARFSFLFWWLMIAGNSLLVGQEKLAEQLRKSDANGDGKLTPAEAPERAQLIKEADADKSGDVTLVELTAFLKARKEAMTPDKGAPPVTTVLPNFPKEGFVSVKSCKAAAAHSDAANGHAVVVMYQGNVIFEHYANGWAADKTHRLASGTKSFSGALLALAVKEGLIENVKEPVSETITEWADKPGLVAITLEQLLSLTSGIDSGKVGAIPGYSEAIVVSGVKNPAGEKFSYGPVPFQIFGEVIRRKLEAKGEAAANPVAFLKAKIFEPIGMEVGQWRLDEEGNPHLPSGVFIKATEWVKFGEFLRTDAGKILDTKTMARAVKGSNANPKYGLTFWLSEYGYQASGAGMQRLYVLPKQDLVVVRFGETVGNKFNDELFLKALLGAPGSAR